MAVFKPGKELLVCEPFAYVTDLHSFGVCDICLKFPDKKNEDDFRLCRSCTVVPFCSEECEKIAKEGLHQYECEGLREMKELGAVVFPTLARFLVRIIGKLQDGQDHYDEIETQNGTVKRRFEDLITHSEEMMMDQERLEEIQHMITFARLVLDYVPEVKLPGNPELIKMCGRIMINSFCLGADLPVGAGLYLKGSVCNHSCDPQVVQTFDGRNLVFRTIKEIPAGSTIDQLTCSYIQTVRPSDERRKLLMERYYFHCECERCVTGRFDREMRGVLCKTKDCNTEIAIAAIANGCTGCGNRMSERRIYKIVHAEMTVKDQLTSGKPDPLLSMLTPLGFSETHWLMLCLYNQKVCELCDEENWSEAFDYGLKVLKGMRFYCGDYDVELGRALIKMAELAISCNKIDEAEAYFEETCKVIEVTHGKESQFFKENVAGVKQRLEEAKLCDKMEQSSLS